MLPMFLAVADQTIVATALPAIASGLGEIERASWVVVSYLIANTIAAPVYGRLGDTFGRRGMMIFALAIFMLGSVLCALSPNIEFLTAARVLQGFGGGGLMTLSQALIGEAIPPRERGKYQGYLAGIAVTSSTFGPVAGGYLTQAFGWQSVFLINVPLGLVAFFLVLRLDARPGDRRRTTFDTPGLVLFIMFVSPVILALEQVQRMDARTLPMAFGLLAFGIFALVATDVAGAAQHRAASAAAAVQATLGLAQRRAGRLPRRRTGLPDHLSADLSARGARHFAGGNRPDAAAADFRHRRRLADHRPARHPHRMHGDIPVHGLVAATAGLVFLAFGLPHLSLGQMPWVFVVIALCMGSVMGVVQITVQTEAGRACSAPAPPWCSSPARSAPPSARRGRRDPVRHSRRNDRETASLFGTIIDQGPDALARCRPRGRPSCSPKSPTRSVPPSSPLRCSPRRHVARLVLAAAAPLADARHCGARRHAANSPNKTTKT